MPMSIGYVNVYRKDESALFTYTSHDNGWKETQSVWMEGNTKRVFILAVTIGHV